MMDLKEVLAYQAGLKDGMGDADKEIKYLREEREKWINRCYHADEKVADLSEKVAELQAAQPHWVSVEEPPKEEGRYLTLDKAGFVHLNWWGTKYGWAYDPKLFCYWMPIPEPPQEVQDGTD